MNEQLEIEELSFEIRRSDKRKTIGITVDRGGDLRLDVPTGVPRSIIEDVAEEKLFWVYKKLAEKGLYQRPKNRKEFVTGEGFTYLGRSYRLLLTKDSNKPLKLANGRFLLLTKERNHARQHFIEWYRTAGSAWLQRRVELYQERLGVKPSNIEVRDLGYRWGSCGDKGTLNFHWHTVLIPPPIADYVIVHELAHLIEKHHTSRFWGLVERVLPDYQSRKQWLAENGGDYGF
ncbi:MAG: SprT family zinc-dependent metalloprotease [Sedimenticola sp.]